MRCTTSNTGPKRKRPAAASRNGRRHTFLRLLKLNRPQLPRITLAAVCVLLVNGALLLKPYILKTVIDDFLVRRVPQRGMYTLPSMGALYFAVVALSGFFSVAQANLINRAGQETVRNLRGRVFKTIQLLPLSDLDKISSGSLITRATNDVEAVSELYTDVLLGLFKDVFLIFGIVGAMLAMDVRLTLISFCVLPAMFMVIFLLRKKIKENFRRMKNLIGRINGFMAETLSGIRLIQIFHGERERKNSFTKLNGEYYKVTSFQVWMNSFLKPASLVFENLTVALLIWYGMGRIAGGALEIGVLYAFTTYIRQFFDPIANLADSYTGIQSAFVSADRIFELLDRRNTLERLDDGLPAARLRGGIEFRHVWFSYNGRDWVLKDVSFTVRSGQTAAFVGATGAGKTTIISLVSGFYPFQKGRILIDGVDIGKIRKRDLRRNIAVVLQDVFLFSGTVEQNITLDDPIPRAEVERALDAACARDFVERLPGGLRAPVMERGSTLSAGQRQLLSFARAVAHNPSVVVLDEATANIDSQTEALIQRAIGNVSRGRTTLMIAHRLSTVRNADTIFVLSHGRIVQSGSHEELMEQGGPYKRMVLEGSRERNCSSA